MAEGLNKGANAEGKFYIFADPTTDTVKIEAHREMARLLGYEVGAVIPHEKSGTIEFSLKKMPVPTPVEIPPATPEELGRARQAGVFKIAAEYGVGSVARGDQIHILNILKQHYRVTDIAQVTEEMARAAFEDRKIMQGAVDLDAQQALNRRIQTFRADQIRRNQESMLPGPKTFTRDALFREAEEALGADQAHDFMAIQDSLAQHWAEENGRSADEWYEAQIWQRGGYDGGEGLAQEVGVGVKNRSLTNSELANYARSLIRAGEDDVRRAVSYEDSRKAKIALLDAVYQIDPQMAKRVARRVDGLAQVNDTPAFRAWFADSKVVGQDGKPLLVYHGTNKLFNQFDASYSATNDFPGFFFTQDARNASMYASSWGDQERACNPRLCEDFEPG